MLMIWLSFQVQLSRPIYEAATAKPTATRPTAIAPIPVTRAAIPFEFVLVASPFSPLFILEIFFPLKKTYLSHPDLSGVAASHRNFYFSKSQYHPSLPCDPQPASSCSLRQAYPSYYHATSSSTPPRSQWATSPCCPSWAHDSCSCLQTPTIYRPYTHT